MRLLFLVLEGSPALLAIGLPPQSWHVVFYVPGALGAVWCAAWAALGLLELDDPASRRHVAAAARGYVGERVADDLHRLVHPPPEGRGRARSSSGTVTALRGGARHGVGRR